MPAAPMRRRLCVAALALPTLAARGRSVTLEPGDRGLAEALRSARDGDTIELQPGTYRGEVAVITQRGLTLRGRGAGVVLEADGQAAEGKAILVVRGDALLENLEFRGTRVPDGNGAGVRFERGRLRVRRCAFFDNEMGLLTANEADMTLEVVDSRFGAAPRHAGPLHHLLYIGAIGSAHVQGCRIEQGWRGHLLKCRARTSQVLGNWLVDGPQGEASYELEFPEGGDHLVAGNVIAQGAATQNPALVSIGAEAGGRHRARVRMLHNTLVSHAGPEARFLHWHGQRLAADSALWLRSNLLAGAGSVELPPGSDAGGNEHVDLRALRDAAGADYRATVPRRAPRAPGDAGLLPVFMAPLGTRTFKDEGLLVGALQDRG